MCADGFKVYAEIQVADLSDCFVEPALIAKTPKYRHEFSTRYLSVILKIDGGNIMHSLLRF